MSQAQIPKQKISLKEKKKDDYKVMKDTVKAYINRADFNSKRKQELYALYDLYNGKNDISKYKYVTDPYNTEQSGGKKRNFPAKLRSYNIIKPVVDLLVGERSQRPMNYQVVVRNGDIKNKYEEYRTQQYMSYLEQEFVNQMNKAGVETGIPSKPLPEPEEFADIVKTSYRDKRAILGQQAIDYIVDRVELDDKFQTGFFDWVVTGEVVSCKGVLFGEVDYDIVSPTEFIYECSPSTKFYEDGDMAGQRKMMSVNQVVDMFYDVLTEDEIDQLENPTQNTGDGFSMAFINRMEGKSREEQQLNDRLVEVYHINFKSFQKIGFLEVPDMFGEMEVIEVDETYKPMPGESIEWHWVSQTWEAYQIDGNIYKHIRPVEPQRNELSNKSTAKLSYNGCRYSDRNTENISIVQMGIPYQELYNVFHYRLELSIAKNKDKIALLEINTIPKHHGWDEEKFMYHADALGYAFIDSTAAGQNKERVNFNQFQVLDMSLGQYIAAQFELLQAIKNEWEEFLGISRQRKGQIMASDGARNSQAAIGQSSIMTNELFRKFAQFEERELQGCLDIAKVAWKEGKQASYLSPEERSEILDIGPDDIQEADLGIFVKNSTKEQEKLDALKMFSQEFAQNGAQPSTVAEILDSNNFASIKEKVKEAEKAQKAWEKEMSEMQSKQQQELQQMQAQAQQEERQFKMQEQDKDIASNEKIESEKIQVEWAKLGQQPEPPKDDSEFKRQQLDQKDREIQQKERISDKDRASNEKMKNKELTVKEKIEMAKARAAKNKPKT